MCKIAQAAPGSERQRAGQKPECLIDPQRYADPSLDSLEKTF